MTETVVEGLRLAGEVFWETRWALVGFTVAGAVEAFVSEERTSAVLGGNGRRELGLGTVFGAASSRCSLGAVATTESPFERGASPVASGRLSVRLGEPRDRTGPCHVGLVPPQGEAGGTAPSGYTLYLNAVFTLLLPGQVYVGHWATQSGEEPAEHEMGMTHELHEGT